MSEEPEHELVLPPISDNDNICLPLSINAVAKYWNIDLPISEANEIASKYAGMNGSILIEGINLAERHGLSSLIIHSSISELKQVIDLGIPPNNSTALCLLGGILNEQNNPECVSYYEKSLEKNENCYLAYRGLGNFYLKNQEFDKSEKNYTRAIEINESRFGPIYKNRGYVRQQQNKIDDAKQDYQNYIKFTPNAKDRGMIERALNEM